MTGTDPMLFEALGARAQRVRVGTVGRRRLKALPGPAET